MMIAGIDVGQRKIVIAYKSSSEIPIFERIYRKNDRSTSIFICKKLIEKGINKVAFEDPDSLREDIKITLNVKRYRAEMNIILFLEKFEIEELKKKLLTFYFCKPTSYNFLS